MKKAYSGIYCITNNKNGKFYIGQSQDIFHRWENHVYHKVDDSKKGFYRDMHEDGLENFSFEILELCPVEELNLKERKWILKTECIKKGYNTILPRENKKRCRNGF